MPTPREVTESLCCNLRDRKSNIATANVATLLDSWAIIEISSKLIITFQNHVFVGIRETYEISTAQVEAASLGK
tara:strand:- start:1111 stop:1332 length:222 start_codon:yes stop_codon:yes gene_type:complete